MDNKNIQSQGMVSNLKKNSCRHCCNFGDIIIRRKKIQSTLIQLYDDDQSVI